MARSRLHTTGALLVNPRPSKKHRKVRRNSAKRRVVRHNVAVKRRVVRANRRTVKRNPLALRANRKHRVVRRNRRTVKRNPLAIRANRRHVAKRNPLAIRANRRRTIRRRRNPLMVRRNSGVMGIFDKIGSMFRGIPVIGPYLAQAVSMGGTALLGAISVEPTLWIAKFIGPYFPMVSTTIFYPIVGVALAAAVQVFGKKFLPGKFCDDLSLAIASAAGAVAFYKYRTGQESDIASEAGMLEISSPFAGLLGGGETYRVLPFDQQYAPQQNAAQYAGIPVYGK